MAGSENGISSHDALFQWAKNQAGYLSEEIELSKDQEKGFCIRAKSNSVISAGSLIARCPITATLSVLNALDAPGFSCHGTVFPAKFLELNCFTIQCFLLMDQYHFGSKSYWYPFFQTLSPPSEVGEFTPFQRQDLEWLDGTNLASALQNRLDDWRTDFDLGLALLRKLNFQRAIDGVYTWDMFRWAAMVFSSRGFSSAVLMETHAADIARPYGRDRPEHRALLGVFEQTFAVLVPVLDMLNYRPVSRVVWHANANHVGLQILEDLQPGQEVCNNYGPKDNDQLILGYGFAIPSNPFDSFAVSVFVPAGSPLATVYDQRREHAKGTTSSVQSSGKEHLYQIFNPSHPTSKPATNLHRSVFSDDLLDAILILSANTSELQSRTFETHRSFLDPHPNERFGRLMANAFTQLQLECQAKVRNLQIHDPSNKGKLPINQMQRYANINRQSQLRIVITAVEACKYCLDIARGLRSVSIPDQSTVSPELYEFLKRAPPTITHGELFNFDSVVKQFWPALAQPLKMIAEIFDVAHRKVHFGSAAARQSLIDRLALMIVVYLTRACHGSADTQSRARWWIQSMTKWYPTDSTELCSPTEDFVKHLELVMNADTEQALAAYAEIGDWVAKQNHEDWDEPWWDPEKLCWAWNVVEEEGVQIPNGPYLLYIPQLDEATTNSHAGP
ncbi:MAG: hypothetical protein Q9160_004835 [Pyrenula sp. 1 TL-2023]